MVNRTPCRKWQAKGSTTSRILVVPITVNDTSLHWLA